MGTAGIEGRSAVSRDASRFVGICFNQAGSTYRDGEIRTRDPLLPKVIRGREWEVREGTRGASLRGIHLDMVPSHIPR